MRAELEIDKVSEDTDREIAIVKQFLSSVTPKAVSVGAAPSESDLQDNKISIPFLIFKIKGNLPGSGRLKRINLSKTSSAKTSFENFWANFESIVDQTSEPAKYEMIRLKTCFKRKAEEAGSRL